jgi:hypothetical protein
LIFSSLTLQRHLIPKSGIFCTQLLFLHDSLEQLNQKMFESVCSFPLSADLFAQSIHPREPIVSVGLSTGHVQTFRLPSTNTDEDDEDGADDEDEVRSKSSSINDGRGHIDTLWETRRHKGSCRCLAFGIDGETLYSAGTDGIVKAANVETGVVESKIAIPLIKERHFKTTTEKMYVLS